MAKKKPTFQIREDGKCDTGRPMIEFKPEWCDQLIKHMGKGFSFESFAGTISVSKETLYQILKREPTFSDAKKIGVEKCRYFWENLGISGTMGMPYIKIKEDGIEKRVNLKAFNSTAWLFNMKNRFTEDWRDRHETDITTKGEKITNEIDITKLSPEELKLYTEISRKLRE